MLWQHFLRLFRYLFFLLPFPALIYLVSQKNSLESTELAKTFSPDATVASNLSIFTKESYPTPSFLGETESNRISYAKSSRNFRAA